MPQRHPMSFWWALATFVVMAVIGVVLGAEPLDRKAEALEPSALRTAAVAVTGPLARTSAFLHLDWPRQQVAGEPQGGEEEAAGPAITGPGTTGAAGGAPSTVAGGADLSTTTSTTAAAAVQPDQTSTTSTSTTTTTLPVFTKEATLRVLVVGDSLMDPVGFALRRRVDSYPALEVKVMTRASSGLVRPDFYDWPKVLARAVADFRPRVTVMLFGGNEKQVMRVEGLSLRPFSDEWNAEYARRVRQVVEITTSSGGTVVWVGLPIMRSGKFSETARTLNAFYGAACVGHPGAVYVDGYTLFTDAGGNYSPYLPDPSGKKQLMRASDGIHFTNAGGDRIADAVMRVLLERFRLE